MFSVKGFFRASFLCISFSRLESKVQLLESQQRGELEDMRLEKNRLQVQLMNGTSVCYYSKETSLAKDCLDRCLSMY